MNLEESINSDDIEIAELAANLLLEEVGYEKVTVLLIKNNKYDYVLKDDYIYLERNMFNIWNKYKSVNTPLLYMTELKNNIIYTNGEEEKLTFDLPYKIEEDEKGI